MTTRILALVSDCYGVGGGIARYNQDLFEALAGEAEIVVLPRYGTTDGASIPPSVTQLPAIGGRIAYSLEAIRLAWSRRPFDILFCGHPFIAPLAWAIARLLGARFWIQGHGTDIVSDRRAIVRRAIEAADMVSTVSRGTRASLLEWANVPPHRARVLPDTVRAHFSPGPPAAALVDRIKPGPGPVLLTVARLSASERYKGHEQVFAALPELRRRYPDLVYLVAGDGDDRQRLEARARELAGGEGVVRFLGFVPEEDLLDLYRLSSVYVMPSTQEGFGIVYLEAAACGVRVVGAHGGGSADAIPDGRVGVLVDAGDRAALVEAVAGQLAAGKADISAVEPYRHGHFAEAARLLLARVLARPCRMRDAA